jgi:hypothetical protein
MSQIGQRYALCAMRYAGDIVRHAPDKLHSIELKKRYWEYANVRR